MSAWEDMSEDERDALKRKLCEKADEHIDEMRSAIIDASDSTSDLTEIGDAIWNDYLEASATSEIEKVRMMNMRFNDDDEDEIRSSLKDGFVDYFFKRVDDLNDEAMGGEVHKPASTTSHDADDAVDAAPVWRSSDADSKPAMATSNAPAKKSASVKKTVSKKSKVAKPAKKKPAKKAVAKKKVKAKLSKVKAKVKKKLVAKTKPSKKKVAKKVVKKKIAKKKKGGKAKKK